MKMMKKVLLSLLLVVAGCFAFAKPVTVDYFNGLTFETDSDYIGKYIPKSCLLDYIAKEMKLNNTIVTDIYKVNYKDTTDMRELDIAFFEEITNKLYAEVWIDFGETAVGVWYVTEDKEVYYVEYQRVEEK